jgi:hypothetical protein
MGINIIIKDVEQDVIRGVHDVEGFVEHIANYIAIEFGFEKEAAVSAVTAAVNSAPLGDHTSETQCKESEEVTVGKQNGLEDGETTATSPSSGQIASNNLSSKSIIPTLSADTIVAPVTEDTVTSN